MAIQYLCDNCGVVKSQTDFHHLQLKRHQYAEHTGLRNWIVCSKDCALKVLGDEWRGVVEFGNSS